MTTYRSIDPDELDHKSPVTEPLMVALADNPTAIAEGAAGAPRIRAGALDTSEATASVAVGTPPTVAYVTLGPYAFTPAIGTVPAGWTVGYGSNTTEDADAPMLRIDAPSGGAATINVAWRRVNA